jgi:hypothetical protein
VEAEEGICIEMENAAASDLHRSIDEVVGRGDVLAAVVERNPGHRKIDAAVVKDLDPVDRATGRLYLLRPL